MPRSPRTPSPTHTLPHTDAMREVARLRGEYIRADKTYHQVVADGAAQMAKLKAAVQARSDCAKAESSRAHLAFLSSLKGLVDEGQLKFGEIAVALGVSDSRARSFYNQAVSHERRAEWRQREAQRKAEG